MAAWLRATRSLSADLDRVLLLYGTAAARCQSGATFVRYIQLYSVMGFEMCKRTAGACWIFAIGIAGGSIVLQAGACLLCTQQKFSAVPLYAGGVATAPVARYLWYDFQWGMVSHKPQRHCWLCYVRAVQMTKVPTACLGRSTALGVAYPAYASYKTIRSKDPHPEVNHQMSQWLTYWAVWSTLTAAESLLPRRYMV